jgi:hypothetical protein
MSAPSWDEVESLFDEVVGLTPDERVGLLDARCTDRPALRQELDSLLAAHDRATEFLRAPTDVAAAAFRSNESEPSLRSPASARPQRGKAVQRLLSLVAGVAPPSPLLVVPEE